MERKPNFVAHTPGKSGEWHDLVLHLEHTAVRAQENGAKFGAGKVCYLAGLWHDIGKFNPVFQVTLCFVCELLMLHLDFSDTDDSSRAQPPTGTG